MDQILNIMRALADPTRLRIALLIRQLELSVGEVVQILGQSQPRVSRHIRILDEAGIARRRKEGSWVFLRPGPILLSGQLDAVFSQEGGGESRDAKRDLDKLEQVRAARADMAASYFAVHASEWDQLRSLHVAESEVEAAMQAILQTAPLGAVLDVGTGTGRMIELFSSQATHFTAIDNNTEMLRVARAKLSGAGDAASRVEIMLGDFNALPLDDAQYDTILFHQVLHYAQAPERVIAEAARVLAPLGRILIVDFAAHDREELRSVHAHARLGFSDETIAAAFASCGIHMAHQATLDGGELTVKIWMGQKNTMSADKPHTHNPQYHDTKLRIVS
jgi:ubiquinone/menaquinone biosynthesis C-methylase UbiE/DNA-binding transcriptional ArsR family regulator